MPNGKDVEVLALYKSVDEFITTIFGSDAFYTILIMDNQSMVHSCSNVDHDKQARFLEDILDTYKERDKSTDGAYSIEAISKKFS